MSTRYDVVLYGASVRGAAQSAVRAGLTPLCVDLFCDWDLRRIADCRQADIGEYPRSVLDPRRHPERTPWIYLGGLENAPDLLEEMACCGPLIGNRGAALSAVRDPFSLAELLQARGIAAPQSHASDDGLAVADGWLVKPYRSSAGRGIVRWTGEPIPQNAYLQRYCSGPAYSAVFLGREGKAALIGATRQLVGEAFCGAMPFAYCGSIGPIDSEIGTRGFDQLNAIGEALVDVGLRGIFGVDFIQSDDLLIPIEVNPRWTASVETLERSAGKSLFPSHLSAFAAITPEKFPSGRTVVGKAIAYATKCCTVAAGSACYDDIGRSDFADVPMPGTIHRAGEPILTVLAEAESADECRRLLESKVEAVRSICEPALAEAL